MQPKSLSLSILTAITLIGCGGGGGSSSDSSVNNNPNTPEENNDFQQWGFFEINGGYN